MPLQHYLGNLGQGPGLFQLINNIIKNKNVLEKMKNIILFMRFMEEDINLH